MLCCSLFVNLYSPCSPGSCTQKTLLEFVSIICQYAKVSYTESRKLHARKKKRRRVHADANANAHADADADVGKKRKEKSKEIQQFPIMLR